jgi:formylglycine-generating enzyme required for sulfatase activity
MNESAENSSQHPTTPTARLETSGHKLTRITGSLSGIGLVLWGGLEALDSFNGGLEGFGILKGFFKENPWAGWALLVGFILVALLSAYVELRTFEDRRAAHRLANAGAEPKPGYFRIGPYLDKPEDRQEFRRADQAQVEVLDWLANPATLAMPLYLTGDSGTGKSSLLNAYVLPKLVERGWAIVSARAYRDPEAALREALIAGRARRPKEDKTLRDLAESAAEKSPVLLLLDQFEEFLIVAAPEVRVRFAAFVQDLAQRPVKNLRLLLTLRSDYQRELGKVGLPFPHYNHNLYEVGRFDFAAARSFIAGSGLGLEESALTKLLDSAAVLDDTRGRIRPITLNVLGKILLEGRHSLIGLDAARLVRGYLGQTVEQDGVREFAKPVLEQLLTEQGTKQPKTQTEIATATGLEPYAVLAVLNGLGKAGLARPLDVAGGVWELSHDFVARALNAYLGRRPGELGRKALAYGSPALFAALLAAVGVYELAVAAPERAKREPILPVMVDIPVGGFCMGSRKDAQEPVPAECEGLPLDPEDRDNEKPVHWVKIEKAFQLGKYEVTVAEFERFVNAQQAAGQRETSLAIDADSVKGLPESLKSQPQRLPMVNVSYEEALAYTVWLTKETGRKFRLPTEAEWEYAARAGSQSSRYWGDDPKHQEACRYANVLNRAALPNLKSKGFPITWAGFDCDAPDRFDFSAPVGQFQPNAFGLHDMLGNVFEWVDDCYHDNYEDAPKDQAAWVDGTKCARARRVIRGGSWSVIPGALRSAYRFRGSPDNRDGNLGFRLAQDL